MAERRSRRRLGRFGAVALLALLVLLVLRLGFGSESAAPPATTSTVTPVARPDVAGERPPASPLEAPPPRATAQPLRATAQAHDAEAASDPPPSLRVIDPDGVPLPHALVYPAVSKPADWAVSRTAELIVLPAPTEWETDPLPIHVGALGFRRRQLEIRGDGPWPRDVVLERSTILDIEFDVRSDLPVDVLSAVISAPGWIYEDGPEGDTDVFAYKRLVGEPEVTAILGSDRPMTVSLTEGAAPYRVFGLRPGQLLRVEAGGPAGSRMASEEVVLDPGEHRVLTLVITEPARALEGRVVDSDGHPLGSIDVNFRPANGASNTWQRVQTDAAGRYRFEVLCTARASVVVSAEGFARHEASLDLDASSSHDIVLQPAPAFVLQVLQADSLRPVLRASIRDSFAGWDFYWRMGEPGEYRPEHLPWRHVDIQVRHRGREYAAVYEPGDLTARCLIDETGDVILHGLIPDQPGRSSLLRLHHLDDETRWLQATDDEVRAGHVQEVPPGDYSITQVIPGKLVNSWTPVSRGTVSVRPGATLHAVLTPVGGR